MSGTTINPYRFGGQVGYRRDSPARQYVRARHLDTKKGRWTSQDPLGFGGGDDNLYRYVGNNPVNAWDASGLVLTPCTSSPPPSVLGCTPPTPLCVGISNNYYHSYGKTGNSFESCASCVSSFICDFVKACEYLTSCNVCPLPLLPIDPVIPVSRAACSVVSPALQCINSCMAAKWRAKTTPLWRAAHSICLLAPRSPACCQASVRAEQAGYTDCAGTCPGAAHAFLLLPYSVRLQIAFQGLHCCD